MISVRSSLRFFMLAVVSSLLLALAVGGVSAAPADFNPISPGEAESPGPILNELYQFMTYEWEVAEGTGTVVYVWNVKINGGEPLSITVPDEQILVVLDKVNWVPEQAEEEQILGAIVDGTYEWYVEATDDNGTTTSSSFYFQVDLPDTPTVPGAFNLLQPANNALFRTVPSVVNLTWEPSANAGGYHFDLLHISNNTRLGPIENFEIHPIEAECDEPTAETVCTFPLNFTTINTGEPLTDGLYAWTLTALNDDGEVEASNGPWLFTINTGAIELITNGGFEVQGANKATPANWNRPLGGPSGKRVCNAAALPTNVSGLCAMKGTGIPGAMVQKVPNAFVQSLALVSGDTLSVSGLLQAKNAPAAGSRIVIQIKGTGGTGGNIVVPLAAATYGDSFEPLSGTLSNLPLPAGVTEVTRIKVKIVSASKFFLDDLSISVDPVAVTPPLGSIPVPAAP